MRKWLILLCILLVLVPAWLAVQIFLIGEPVDGNTLAVDVEESEHQLTIHFSTPASAIAFSDVRFRHKGTALHITVRQVLVSPLHNSGTHCIYIEKADETEVWLGGRLIWEAK